MIVGESEALLAAVDVACRVARSSGVTSLLIEGETGVGKELFARLVHAGSRRTANDPFIAMNCGAITRELFGSELFGHVAGAFTGATREGKPGVFELANGGVLSLDEIGEMPLEIQPFLLRVLEERVVHRIGDSRGRPVDVRLIASTNRDLKQEVAAGRFRRDLYYRIGAVSIHVPPLRERGDDVLLLLEHFNRQIAARTGEEPLEFSHDALDALLAYRWPGNVRELKNLVERLHVLARGRDVGLHDLPAEITASDSEPRATSLVQPTHLECSKAHSVEAERQAMKNAIGSRRRQSQPGRPTARISRPTLYRKLDQYGIRRGFLLSRSSHNKNPMASRHGVGKAGSLRLPSGSGRRVWSALHDSACHFLRDIAEDVADDQRNHHGCRNLDDAAGALAIGGSAKQKNRGGRCVAIDP